MRLRDMQKIIGKVEVDKLYLDHEHYNDKYYFSNLSMYKSTLTKVSEIEIFSTDINIIKNSPLFETTLNSCEMEEKSGEHVKIAAFNVYNSTRLLQRMLETILPVQDEAQISVKMPESTNLEDFIAEMNKLNTAISQVVHNKEINGQVIIKNWEPGSFWMDLFLGTKEAVFLIASIAWASVVINNKIKEGKMLDEKLRGIKIENDHLEHVADKHKIIIDELLEAEANNILHKDFDSENHDMLARIKNSINIFTEMLSDGLEVHSALEGKDNVKEIFPDYKKMEFVESKIKLLDSESENDSTDIIE
jgi:hypothetical protein